MLTGTAAVTRRVSLVWCLSAKPASPAVPPYTMAVVPKVQIDAFREEFLQELPQLAREYVDTARAEATTAAYEKVMNTALKVIDGLEVQKQKDVYANLPVIHISFGPGMEMATQVELPKEVPALVEDVTPKETWPFPQSAHTLPDDPLELLAAPDIGNPISPEDDETLNALSLASSAMALD